MDTGEGRFKMMLEEEAAFIKKSSPNLMPRIFNVGEEVTIRESRFKIVKITPKKLTLRLLPKEA